jgi:predicted Zn-dependent peptidase
VAASLAAVLFGGGMSSPFTDTVRERLGLAYTADASAEGGDNWYNLIVHAVTSPEQLVQLATVTGTLLRAQAEDFDAVHLERAKNQLAVSRVRSSERPYAAMERAVEELFARGTITPAAEHLALIEAVTAKEVRAVFARLLTHPPALAIAGKGATHKRARELAALLVGATATAPASLS